MSLDHYAKRGRGKSSAFFAVAELGGSEAGELLKVLAEEEAIAVADGLGDPLDGVAGIAEAAFGLADALAAEPVDRAGAEGGLEETGEVRLAHAGEGGKFGDGMGLKVEELHAFNGLTERGGNSRIDALASAADEGQQPGDGGVEERGGFWRVAGEKGEDFVEKGHGIGDGKDRVGGGREHSTHLVQAWPFDANPEHLPGVCWDGAVFVGVGAVDPGQGTRADAMSKPLGADVASAAKAINQLMAGEMFAADAVVGAADHVAGARHGVKDVLVDRVGGCVEGDGEPGCHSRIVQRLRTIRHCEGGGEYGRMAVWRFGER